MENKAKETGVLVYPLLLETETSVYRVYGPPSALMAGAALWRSSHCFQACPVNFPLQSLNHPVMLMGGSLGESLVLVILLW